MGKYLWDIAILLVSFGVTFMVTESWPWAYWPGLAGVYGGLLLLGYHLSKEEFFRAWPLGTRIAVGVIGLCCVYIWSANIVFARLPINITVVLDAGNYPAGTDVAGIQWNPRYSDVRLTLANPTKHDYSDVDLSVSTDSQIAQIGQVTDIPNVSFFPQNQPAIFVLRGADGQDLPVQPMKGAMQSGPIYRVRIDRLPKNSAIQLAVATVRINPMIPGKGMPAQLFGPELPPKWVSIKGSYRAFAREREVAETKTF